MHNIPPMNRLFRSISTPLAAASSAMLLLIVSSSMLFVSCRPSRQESRRPSTQANANSGSQSSLKRQVDSLLIVEDKLLEVIDSMTSLVNADHSRIRELERQVREIQTSNATTGTPLPPRDDPYTSHRADQSYASTAPPTFQDRYNAALHLFNEHDFESALTQFQSLERDDPDGAYASNYKYWEGECYYGEKRYNMALQSFGMTVSMYPNSTKAAAAQFKTGECYEKLQIPSSARQAYERVIADYPSSEYKARAQSNLNALR